MNSNYYCIIMAGGIGSRFWPLSKKDYPKQFIDILGVGKSLIQLTYERFVQFIPKENFLVVTHEDYKELVQEQLPYLQSEQILCEPHRKNTAPCIAYAAHKIFSVNPNAYMVVAPSDHLVMQQEIFTKTILTAFKKAASEDCLVTLGIKPSRPDTGYGYIQFTNECSTEFENVCKVKTFTEKPTLEIAKEFLQSGEFYWNSGIFVWSVHSILSALKMHLSSVYELFDQGHENIYNSTQETDFIKYAYQESKNISIDYGVMEKSENVYVVLSDFGWSDLGTWGSLYTHVDRDINKNAIIGNQIKLYDCEKNMIRSDNSSKLIVLQGLSDYIIVDTQDVLLVCKKQEEQKIKEMVSDLKNNKLEKYT